MSTPRSSTHQRLSDQKNYTLENQEVGGSFQTPVLTDGSGTYHAFSGTNQDDGSFTGRGGSNAEQSQTKVDLFDINIQLGRITAGFSANVTSGAAPLTVTFTNTSTGVPTQWFWDFGDGQTSRLENPTHTYTADGSYTVRLVASNARGGDAHEVTGYITVSSVSPLVEVFQDVFATNGSLNGLVPTLGGAAWVSPFVNLALSVSGGHLTTGVPGFGADARALINYDPNPLASLSTVDRFAIRLSLPGGMAVPTGGASAEIASASLAVIRDLAGPNEDTAVYLEIAGVGASATLGALSNTVAALMIIPGVGTVYHNISSGANLSGSQVFELILNNTNGSWSLTRNGTQILSGSSYASNFNSTDTATAVPQLYSPTVGPAVTVAEIALLEG
jgi:PKD repeat protein